MATETPNNDLRRELEQEAELTRARLIETIDQLEQRGHDAFDWRMQLRRHSGALTLVGSACAATAALPVAVAIYRAATRPGRMRDERAHALMRFWEHPERVAVKRRRAAGWFGQALLLGAGALALGVAIKYSGQKRALLVAPPVEPFAV
jgi:hypothetical protein